MQGVSAAQFLVGIPLFGLPMVLYSVLYYLASFQVAIVAMGLVGLIGFLCRKQLIDMTTKAYRNKKYRMIAGFKEKNS